MKCKNYNIVWKKVLTWKDIYSIRDIFLKYSEESEWTFKTLQSISETLVLRLEVDYKDKDIMISENIIDTKGIYSRFINPLVTEEEELHKIILEAFEIVKKK